MRKTDKEIEQKRRERFELMAVRHANLLKMSNAKKFEELPLIVRRQLDSLSYSEIVRPLMIADKADGASVRQLAFRYGLPKSTVQRQIEK